MQPDTKLYLAMCLDTESNGLPQYGKDNPADGADQPRICGLAVALFGETINDVVEQFDCLIKPDGWTIGEDTTAIHGLTDAVCEAEGVPIASALNVINQMMDRADVIVGHNIAHDLKLLRGEFRRAGLPDRYGEVATFCTMWSGRKALGLKKIPNLSEALMAATGAVHEEAHRAKPDMLASAQVYFAVRERLPVPVPKLPKGAPIQETPDAA